MPEEEKEVSKPESEEVNPPAIPENRVVTLGRGSDPEPTPPENENITKGD